MDKYSPKPTGADLEKITSAHQEAAISMQGSLGHYWLLEGGPWLGLVACWHLVPDFYTRELEVDRQHFDVVQIHQYLLIKQPTCIHVSSICSGEVSGDVMAGGNGWMSFGTTTRSLPRTKIAPALFAVPQ
jgi:hypothetical protein